MGDADADADAKQNQGSEPEAPGLRFHPTEQELLGFYLKKMVEGKLHNFEYIGRPLDVYSYDPWDLPSSSRWGEDRFFFVPRDKKCQIRGRFNRITTSGFWKATGSDHYVRDEHGKPLGLKKTLIFYRGRAYRGEKTDWVMKEYRMPDEHRSEVVLCRIQRKTKPLGQRGIPSRIKSPEQRGIPTLFNSLDQRPIPTLFHNLEQQRIPTLFNILAQRAITQPAEAKNSMGEDLDYKSQETSMVSPRQSRPLNVRVEHDEVKKIHHFEASSSMENNTATNTDLTSSKDCDPVDPFINWLTNLGKSTASDIFTDSVFPESIVEAVLAEPNTNNYDFGGSDYDFGGSLGSSDYDFSGSLGGSNNDFGGSRGGSDYDFSGSDAGSII